MTDSTPNATESTEPETTPDAVHAVARVQDAHADLLALGDAAARVDVQDVTERAREIRRALDDVEQLARDAADENTGGNA